MRTSLSLCLLALFSSCAPTANQICDGVPLGASIDQLSMVVTPSPGESWCGGHPVRNPVGPVVPLRCCMNFTSAECNLECDGQSDALLFAVGPAQNEYGDAAQCCVLVRDGKVAARFVAYD